MKYFLIFTLLLTSCTTRHGVGLGALVLAGGAAIAIAQQKDSDEEDRAARREELEVIEVDQSGTVSQLGGAIISATEIAHVTHWPVTPGQTITIATNDGGRVSRKVVLKTELLADLSILHLDRPLDLSRHTLLGIAPAQVGEAVTIERLNRQPIATWITNATEAQVFADTDERTIQSGDSGKRRIQMIEGKPHVVSLNSTMKGQGPNLHKLLQDYSQTGQK
jgi:hypothetical protein